MLGKMGICAKCGEPRGLVNMKYQLCQRCNRSRIEERNGADKPKPAGIQRGASGLKSGGRIKPTSKSAKAIKDDDAFYVEVWNAREPYCEECGIYLGDGVMDMDGKVYGKHRFSHILPKGNYPEFRRDPRNINLMCLEHHTQWDDGDKESMKVYEKNMKSITIMLDERNTGDSNNG